MISLDKNTQFKVLDKGFVRVVDTLGTDSSIVQAARVSYGEGTKAVRDDERLIHYLLKHEHWSPFEMCEIKLHVKVPIFIMRQWIRHRSASYNEYSGRYSTLKEEFYIPEEDNIQAQSKNNKQCRDEALPNETVRDAKQIIENMSAEAFKAYNNLLEAGVAREIARIILPLNTYTEFYWKVDLRSLFNFLKLRLGTGAQFEIREYAQIILDIVRLWCPIALKAFEKYTMSSKTLSQEQLYILKQAWKGVPYSTESLSKNEMTELLDLI